MFLYIAHKTYLVCSAHMASRPDCTHRAKRTALSEESGAGNGCSIPGTRTNWSTWSESRQGKFVEPLFNIQRTPVAEGVLIITWRRPAVGARHTHAQESIPRRICAETKHSRNATAGVKFCVYFKYNLTYNLIQKCYKFIQFGLNYTWILNTLNHCFSRNMYNLTQTVWIYTSLGLNYTLNYS